MRTLENIQTTAIHAGNKPNLKQGGSGDVIPPIHLSTTFARTRVHTPTAGYEYSRSGNPTRRALEENLAGLENARFAFAYSSGLAAITNILMLLSSGDHILSIDDVYGGTRRLFTRVFEKFGVTSTYAPIDTHSDISAYLTPKTKMIWIETPTNPLMKIVDIAAVAKQVKRKNIITVVDNTFASPVFQQPLMLGADIVTHSMTKYIGGHSDVVAGAVMGNDKELQEKLAFLQNAVGAILSPFDSYSVLRGIKTLPVRMKTHEENAKAVVRFLSKHKRVKRVFYPGLPTHPGYAIAKRQMTGFGGIVSLELKGTLARSVRFMESLKLIAVAESLGAVESLVDHPASMTHASVPKAEREKIGLSDTLIRLSVGIEDIRDILSDLSGALEEVNG